MTMPEPPTITPTKLARRLGVTVRTVDRWATLGELPPAFVTPLGRRRWRPSDVEAWIESRTAS